jgi:hypothetical protein
LKDFRTKLTVEDHDKIVELARNNVRTTDIVRALDGKVTKQRIHQIMKKHGVTNARQIREERTKQWTDRMALKWGNDFLDPETRKEAVYQQMREKFRNKKANNYDHEWTVEFGDLTFPTHCPMLGVELDYFAERAQENSVSFDRVDSSKGYVKGNVIVCSWRANRIKNDGTAEEHKKIYEYLSKCLDTSL